MLLIYVYSIYSQSGEWKRKSSLWEKAAARAGRKGGWGSGKEREKERNAKAFVKLNWWIGAYQMNFFLFENKANGFLFIVDNQKSMVYQRRKRETQRIQE